MGGYTALLLLVINTVQIAAEVQQLHCCMQPKHFLRWNIPSPYIPPVSHKVSDETLLEPVNSVDVLEKMQQQPKIMEKIRKKTTKMKNVLKCLLLKENIAQEAIEVNNIRLSRHEFKKLLAKQINDQLQMKTKTNRYQLENYGNGNDSATSWRKINMNWFNRII